MRREAPGGLERITPDQVAVGDVMVGPAGRLRVRGVLRTRSVEIEGDQVDANASAHASVRRVLSDGSEQYPGFAVELGELCRTCQREVQP